MAYFKVLYWLLSGETYEKLQRSVTTCSSLAEVQRRIVFTAQ
jgi:hypothetical protein